jgi:hypothetical protein
MEPGLKEILILAALTIGSILITLWILGHVLIPGIFWSYEQYLKHPKLIALALAILLILLAIII